MQAAAPSDRLRPGWLPRALISGFAATAVMLFTFIVAYGIGLVIGGLDTPPGPQASVVQRWFYALTHNAVLGLASSSLYAALAVHFTFGVLWAVVYGRFAEPRLSGPGWRRGMVFALVLWVFSLVVFLPLVGGGFLGSELGAGPLPVIGNLILHLVYGATLGLVYGPLGDVDMEHLGEPDAARRPVSAADAWANARSEAMAARGLLIGLAIGIGVGAVGAVAGQLRAESLILGLPPLAFVVASGLIAGAFGGFIGSLAGLSAPVAER